MPVVKKMRIEGLELEKYLLSLREIKDTLFLTKGTNSPFLYAEGVPSPKVTAPLPSSYRLPHFGDAVPLGCHPSFGVPSIWVAILLECCPSEVLSFWGVLLFALTGSSLRETLEFMLQ